MEHGIDLNTNQNHPLIPKMEEMDNPSSITLQLLKFLKFNFGQNSIHQAGPQHPRCLLHLVSSTLLILILPVVPVGILLPLGFFNSVSSNPLLVFFFIDCSLSTNFLFLHHQSVLNITKFSHGHVWLSVIRLEYFFKNILSLVEVGDYSSIVS